MMFTTYGELMPADAMQGMDADMMAGDIQQNF